MCTGGCSKVIGITLYVLAAVSIICNIILFFPGWSTKYADHITEEVKYMGGFIGGGIMVSPPCLVGLIVLYYTTRHGLTEVSTPPK